LRCNLLVLSGWLTGRMSNANSSRDTTISEITGKPVNTRLEAW
jgi:hypothetical protein